MEVVRFREWMCREGEVERLWWWLVRTWWQVLSTTLNVSAEGAAGLLTSARCRP